MKLGLLAIIMCFGLIGCGDDDTTTDADVAVGDQAVGDARPAVEPACALLNCGACTEPANSQTCGGTQSANNAAACTAFLEAQPAGECGKS